MQKLIIVLLLVASTSAVPPPGKGRFAQCLRRAAPPQRYLDKWPSHACVLCTIEQTNCSGVCAGVPCHLLPFYITCNNGSHKSGGGGRAKNLKKGVSSEPPPVPAQFWPGSPYFHCLVGTLVERLCECKKKRFCVQMCLLCGVRGYTCPRQCSRVPAFRKPYQMLKVWRRENGKGKAPGK